MKAFKLRPAGTGSTSKSHKSHSQSFVSSSSTSSSSPFSSSMAHAKHATSAAWSACKQGTRSTLKLGASALHFGQHSSSAKAHMAARLDWNQGQPRIHEQSRHVRRLFRLGPSGSKSSYRSLDDEADEVILDDDDDDRDIFSGRPFRESMQVQHVNMGASRGHSCDEHCDSARDVNMMNGHEHAQLALFAFAPQHAASGRLATSTARYMRFAADEGEDDDDEWWR